jgi:DNA polymerase-3 subunit alpha
MSAVLTSEQGNADKLAEFMAEVESLGLKALGPDVNQSDTDFTPVVKDKAIRFGLGAIKGVGEQAARAIVAERERMGHLKILQNLLNEWAMKILMHAHSIA